MTPSLSLLYDPDPNEDGSRMEESSWSRVDRSDAVIRVSDCHIRSKQDI